MTKFLCALVVGAALLVGSGCSDCCKTPTTAPAVPVKEKDKPKKTDSKKCDCTKCTCEKCPGNCDDKDCKCKGCAGNCCKKKKDK